MLWTGETELEFVIGRALTGRAMLIHIEIKWDRNPGNDSLPLFLPISP
jgi:hypothetical protein